MILLGSFFVERKPAIEKVMELLSISPENPDLSRACEVLAAGGLVIFPTETVYGLACDATNAAAVTKLLRVKQRPAGLAMPILVANRDAAEALVELTSEAEQLYASFLPGPVTVVSRVRATQPVDTRLISEFGTMGIRISSHSVAQALAEAYKKPLTATAAAPAGAAKPRNPEALLAAFSEQQREAIDLLLSVGELPAAEPSTVIDTTQAVQRVIRAGAQLHEVLPTITTNSPEETSAHAGELLASYQSQHHKKYKLKLKYE